MPPARRKAAVTANTDQLINSLLDKVERVPVGSLTPHPKNPRQGNVDDVADSLRFNGQFKPIVVQKSNSVILAGNHTWLGARKLGWSHIDVVFVNVTDEVGMRILLADNKTSDDSTYNETMLAEILAHIATSGDGLEGTGYSTADMDDIIASIQADTKEKSAGLDELMSNMPSDGDFGSKAKTKREEYEERTETDSTREAKTARGATKADTTEDDAEEIESEVGKEAELQAILEVKVEALPFWKKLGREGGDDFEIPVLRDDMLLQKLPEPLKTWGGNDATPDDGKSWWLYNYSLGGVKGLPFDRSILAFNTYDDKFEGWWDTPAWYTSKVLAKGLRIAVLPDFSFYYTQPRIVHLWNVYRSLWLGRFFQEAGMAVIPRLQFDYTDPKSLDIALRNIPRNCPVLATSQQNVEDEKVNGPKITKMLQEALDEIKPKQFLYYSGPGGKRAMDVVNYSGETVFLENYVAVRREVAFGKKEGLQGVKKPDRNKILNKARKRLDAANKAEEEEAQEDDE